MAKLTNSDLARIRQERIRVVREQSQVPRVPPEPEITAAGGAGEEIPVSEGVGVEVTAMIDAGGPSSEPNVVPADMVVDEGYSVDDVLQGRGPDRLMVSGEQSSKRPRVEELSSDSEDCGNAADQGGLGRLLESLRGPGVDVRDFLDGLAQREEGLRGLDRLSTADMIGMMQRLPVLLSLLSRHVERRVGVVSCSFDSLHSEKERLLAEKEAAVRKLVAVEVGLKQSAVEREKLVGDLQCLRTELEKSVLEGGQLKAALEEKQSVLEQSVQEKEQLRSSLEAERAELEKARLEIEKLRVEGENLRSEKQEVLAAKVEADRKVEAQVAEVKALEFEALEQHDRGFDRALRQFAFLFPSCDLSELSVSKDVVDGKLAEDE